MASSAASNQCINQSGSASQLSSGETNASCLEVAAWPTARILTVAYQRRDFGAATFVELGVNQKAINQWQLAASRREE